MKNEAENVLKSRFLTALNTKAFNFLCIGNEESGHGFHEVRGIL